MRFMYLAVVAIVLATGLSAADIVWQGGGANTDWATGANWVNGTAPGSSDRAIFSGSGTVNVTNVTAAMSSVQSIQLTGASGQSVTLNLGSSGGPLTISGVGSEAIRLFDGNSLTIDGGIYSIGVAGHIFADNGNLTLNSPDLRFGNASVPGDMSIRQHNGNLVFDSTTFVSGTWGAAQGAEVHVNLVRTQGGTGTVSFDRITIQGDNGGPNSDSIAVVRFDNVDATVATTTTLAKAATMSTPAVDGSGAKLYLRDSTFTYKGDVVVGQSGASALEGPELGLNNSTMTADASNKSIAVDTEAVFTCIDSTLTSTSNANPSWTLDCRNTCDSCVFLNSTVTAYQADRLAILLAGTDSSFQFGLVISGTTFSNYDNEGVRIQAGSFLTVFNGNTFLNGRADDKHLQFQGALAAGSIGTFDNNQFDDTTIGINGKWVTNAGATGVFRAFAGNDFEDGSNVTTAAQAALKTTNTSGNITWSDTGVGLQVSLQSSTNGLTSTTTANQVIALFGLAAVGGDIDVAALTMEIEFSDEGGSFDVATDVAALTLFVDSNNNGTYDSASENGYTTVAAPTSGTNSWATVQTITPEQITTASPEVWGLAITFNSSVATKSARMEITFLPKIGGAGVVPFTMFSPAPTTPVDHLSGLPIIIDSIHVSGVATAGRMARQPGAAASGAAFGVQPQLILTDANGNRATHDNSTVVTALITFGLGTLGTPATATAVNGVVTFSGLQITGTGIHKLGYLFGSPPPTIDGSDFEFMVAVPPPEIDISRGPSIPDGTGVDNAGGLPLTGFPTLHYTVTNSGLGQLTVTAINFSNLVNCNPSINISTTFPWNINSGTSDSVGILPNIGTATAFSFTIEFVNNDPDEASYTFTVNGTGIVSALEMRDGATVMMDGQNTTVTGVVIGTAKTVTYTIVNTGTAPLTLGSFSFSGMNNITGTPTISSAPTSPVAINGGSTTFDITFTATAAVGFGFEFDLPCNDPNYPGGGFNHGFTGTATAGPEPEIDISRNSSPIADGGTDSIAGNILVGANSMFTYTVANTGAADLTISSATTNTDVLCTTSISTAPAAVVTAGNSTTFVLTVNATSAGTWSCVVRVDNNDTNEATYTFTVTGTAAATAPEINIKRGATSIAAGGTDNVGTATLLSYTVENTGSATLTFTGSNVSLSSQTGCTASITTALTGGSIPAASTDLFSITVVPAGGAFSFDILVESDDADESSYVIHVSGNTSTGSGSGDGGSDDEGGCAVSSGSNTLLWALLALLFVPAILYRRRQA